MENEQQLIAEIQYMKQGDFSRYELFYQMTSPFIYKVLLQVIGQETGASNVIADVYNRIYQEIVELDVNQEFYDWAGLIATDMALQFMNNESATAITPSMNVQDIPFTFTRASEDMEPLFAEDILNHTEVTQKIENRIQSFAAPTRLVMQYFYYNNLSITDIAGKMQITEAEVKSHIIQIRESIRELTAPIDGQYNSNLRYLSLSEFPILLNMLRQSVGLPVAHSAMAGVAGTIAISAGNMVGNGVVGSAGQMMGGMSPVGAGAAGTPVNIGAAGTATGGASGSAAVGAGTGVTGSGATTGFFASLGGKIAVGIAATALVTGGGLAIHHVVTADKDDKTTTEIVQEMPSESGEIVSEAPQTQEEVIEEEPLSGMYVLYGKTEYHSENGANGTEKWIEIEGGSEYQALIDAVSADNVAYAQAFDEGFAEAAGNDNSIGDGEYGSEYDQGQVVQRADNTILSFSKSNSGYYAGAAHGWGYTSGINFDVKTGKVLTVQDLGDGVREELIAYAVPWLENYYGPDIMWEGYQDIIKEQIDGDVWYFTGDGIAIVMNQYVIVPYAAGSAMVVVPYDQIPSLKDEYKIGDNNTFTRFVYQQEDSNVGTQKDVDGNGSLDKIYLTYDYNSDYFMSDYTLHLNDESVSIGMVFSCNATYIHTSEGNFVLVETQVENDYLISYLYDVSTGKIVQVGSEENIGNIIIFGDCFSGDSMVDCLGTYTGCKVYKITKNGFEALEQGYHLKIYDERDGLVTKVNVPVQFLQDGKYVDGELEAGVTLTLLTSDEETFATFRTEDGREGKITFRRATESDNNSWGVYINEMYEQDVFDNIMYAG